MPQQAVQKPLPHSVPLPLTASGFAALNHNVKEVVPMCVLYSPQCHHGPALARVASPAVLTPVFSAAVVAKAMCEVALPWGGGMVTRAGTVGCWGSLHWLIHPQLGATPHLVAVGGVQGPRPVLASPFARSDPLWGGWVLWGAICTPSPSLPPGWGEPPLSAPGLCSRRGAAGTDLALAGGRAGRGVLSACAYACLRPCDTLLYDNKALSPCALALVLCLLHPSPLLWHPRG